MQRRATAWSMDGNMKALSCSVLLMLPFSILAQDKGNPGEISWHDRQGHGIPNNDDSKVIDGFGGILLVTSDADWKAKWETPSDTTPVFNRVKSVPRGKPVFVLIFFANPQTGNNGQADVSCDIDSVRPDGTTSVHQVDVLCFKGTVKGDLHNTRLAAPRIQFIGDPGDPAGEWTTRVTLKDNIRHVQVVLKTSFVLLDK